MFEPAEIHCVQVGAGDHLLVCGDAAAELPVFADLQSQAQAVYVDPPFRTGETFTRRRPLGERGWRSGSPSVTLTAYEDTLSEEACDAFLLGLIQRGRALLAPTGLFMLHLDWRLSARGRILCDRVFGRDRFLNELIWAYETGGRSRRFFPRKHDTILLYAASSGYRFQLGKVPIPREGNRSNHMKRGTDEEGRTYSSIRVGGKEYRYYDDEPAYPTDVWTDIGHIQQRDPERTGYPTQKPLRLLERLLLPTVEPGDLVVDLCCGSGTTLAAAQGLGCRFLGVDLSPDAISVSEHRLWAESLRVESPCCCGQAALRADYLPLADQITIAGFSAPLENAPAAPGPVDLLESWYAGHLTEEGVLQAEQRFRRTPSAPALPLTARLTPSHRPVALLAVDAAGRRHGFLWRDS